MPDVRQVAVAVTLALFAGTAAAQSIAGVARPTVLAALVIGLLSGAITGTAGFKLESALTLAIGLLLAACVAMVWFVGGDQPLLSMLLLLLVAAFFGAVPLLVGFIATFALTSWLRRLVRHVHGKASP